MSETIQSLTGQKKLTDRRCTNLQSATEYKFETKTNYFYFDKMEKTITKSKYGNPFYMDGDNYIFRPGNWRRVQLENGDHEDISVLGLGHSITRATLKNHNVIAKIQYYKE